MQVARVEMMAFQDALLSHYTLQTAIIMTLTLIIYTLLSYSYSWFTALLMIVEASAVMLMVIRWIVTDGEGLFWVVAAMASWSMTTMGDFYSGLFTFMLLLSSLPFTHPTWLPLPIAWLSASLLWWLAWPAFKVSPLLPFSLGSLYCVVLTGPLLMLRWMANDRLNKLPDDINVIQMALGYLNGGHRASRNLALRSLRSYKLDELMRVFLEGDCGLVSVLMERLVGELNASHELIQLLFPTSESKVYSKPPTEDSHTLMPAVLAIEKPVQTLTHTAVTSKWWNVLNQWWSLQITQSDADRISLLTRIIGHVEEDVHGQVLPRLDSILSVLLALSDQWRRLARMYTLLDGSCMARWHAHRHACKSIVEVIGRDVLLGLRPDIQARLLKIDEE